MAQDPLFIPDSVTVDGVEYVRAYPVAKGHCAHCGQMPSLWPPKAIVTAAQRWLAEQGTIPSSHAWDHVGRHNPGRGTVLRVFGSWARMYRAAGITPPKFGRRTHWTKEHIADAMIDWSIVHGRWPKYADWRHATPEHPHASQIYLQWRSWDEAIDFARQGERLRLMVPAEPMAAAVRSFVAENGSLSLLAELADVDEALVFKLAQNKKTYLHLDTAEKIASAISRPDVLVAA